MKFSIDSKSLAYALSKCATIAKKNRYKPITRNVHIEAADFGLAIQATDMLSVNLKYYVTDANVDENGTVLVDAETFATFVSAQSGTIKCHTTEKSLMVKCGANKYRLARATGEIPLLSTPENEPVMQLTGEELSDTLSVAVMADTEDSRSFLGGTYLVASNKMLYAMAASDGRYGYAWTKTDYEQAGKFLLPQKAAFQLPYFLYNDDNVRIHFWKNKIVFDAGRFILSANELGGRDKFPAKLIVEWSSLEQEHVISVDGTELAELLDLASVMPASNSSGAAQKITLTTDKEFRLLTIKTAEENNIGSMSLNTVIKAMNGQSFEFDVNPKFVQDIIRVIKKLSKSNLFMVEGATGLFEIGVNMEKKIIFLTSTSLNAIFAMRPMGQGMRLINEQNEA